MNYPGSTSDIVQDLYLRMLQFKILQKYDANRSKISTFLYRVIQNLIMGTILSESRYKNVPCLSAFEDDHPTGEYTDDVDWVVRSCGLDPEYALMLRRNQDSDPMTGLAADIEDFKRSFLNSRKNKKHTFSRRKEKNSEPRETTTLDLLQFLYDGYSNHEIAQMFDVCDMTVSHIKNKLAAALSKHGIGPSNFHIG